MSWVTIIWSMVASACLTLAAVYLLAWCKQRTAWTSRAIGVAAAMCCSVTIETQAAKSTFRSDSEYLIDTWEIEDGLPENSATAMVQTPDGYLWFGTWNGLVRFDGVSFTVFNRGNTPHLPSAGIVDLHLDQSGRLWVSTLGGLVVRDATQWRAFGTNDGWTGNFVRTFTERANGDLLLTTFDGHVLEFVGGRLKELPPPPGQPDQGYYGTVDETGRWWVTQRDFVGRWDGQHWVQIHFPGPSLRDPAVPSLSARDGGVWILFGKNLLKFRQGAEVSRVPVPQMSGGIWSIIEDSRTNVWICSFDSGLFRLDPSGSLQHWTTTNGLGNLGCRFVFEDQERNLWVGTSGGGLTRFKPRRFQDMGRPNLQHKSLAKSVSPASDGGMWMATFDDGLFKQGAAGVSPVQGRPRNEGLYGLSVLEDRVGRVWYGEKDACWWRRGPGSFEKTPLAWARDVNISALFEDSKGRIWFSVRQGVAMYDGHVFHEFGADAGLPPGEVACFGEEHSGVPWLAAEEGVFRYEKDHFVEVRTFDDKPLREILCFKAEPDGTMWMGTRTHGLLRLRDGRVSGIGPLTGFPVQAVHAILEDGLGYLWMPSNRGIMRVAREDLHAVADGAKAQLDYQLLDQDDGLPSVECSTSQPSCAQDRSGRLWFATQRGVAMIDPASFRLNSLPPPVHIEQVGYFSSRASLKTGNRQPFGKPGVARVRLVAPFLEPLRLPPGSYGLEIKYTALSFSSPAKLRFQTRLEENGGDWEDAKGLRIAQFHQLKPGDYVFRVRAANDDGVWNDAGARLAFTVLPFYWQTAWIRVVVGLLLMASGGGAVFWRNRAKRRLELAEMERSQRLSAERKQAEQRFRLVVEASTNGIVLVNHEGRIVLVNGETERLFGYSREELIGQAVEMLVPERLRGAHPGHRAGFFAAPRARPMGAGRELFALRKDGTKFPVEIGLSPIQTAEGILVLTAIVDITARKQVEAEVQRQRGELAHVSRVSTMGQLASALAHELNQPLGAILRNAEAAELFLQSDSPDLEEVRAILADIRKDDQRAGQVIDRMRTLLKRRGLERTRLNLAELVDEVVPLVHPDAVSRQVRLDIEVPRNLPPVRGDRVHLQQVLLNLILNGMDAMGELPAEARRLKVRARQADAETVEVAVADSGHGVPAEKLARLFEPFFTTKPKGMGLGLPISSTIIQAHGGRLWAENRPGGGATFYFTVPVSGEGK